VAVLIFWANEVKQNGKIKNNNRIDFIMIKFCCEILIR